MAKKFKRYFTGSENRAGKGDDRRDSQVDPQTLASNWCATFGHKRWDYSKDMCLDCGTTGETIRLKGAQVIDLMEALKQSLKK